MDLSIIIPTFNEAENIAILIDKINEIFKELDCKYEIIVADAGSKDNTFQIAKSKGIKAFIQQTPGYGGALKDAVDLANGQYIITLDADLSHNPYIIKRLFFHRLAGHVIIASRYIRGGTADMPVSRRILSVILNRGLGFLLSLPIKDISSGFRLYDAKIFKEIDFSERDFNVLVEILVKAYMNGFNVREVPFHYQPRTKGKSHARIFKFGLGYLRVFLNFWKIRNTITSADYDELAFYSRMPFRRYWQRKRYRIILNFTGWSSRVLDVGCGTSKILGALPQAVGLDINFKKLRYNLCLGNPLVNADIDALCFKDAIFDKVICSDVIEHLKKPEPVFLEIKRVLKNDGTLIIATPDYGRLSWHLIEWLYRKIIPGGYADGYVSGYSRKDLIQKMLAIGFQLESHRYILGSELICKFRKIS